MVISGDKPGAGTYICSDCGTSVKLETDTTELPPCPVCGNNTFRAVK